MKISRRSFLGKSLSTLALLVVAPATMISTPKNVASQIGGNIKDKGEVIGFRKYGDFECNDYTRQIKILDWTPGMKIPYESPVKPSCGECMHAHACTGNGKHFAKRKCDDFKPYIEVREYKAGEHITYQDLRTDECSMCAKSAGCTETGKRFTKHSPVQHKPFMPEMWGKKLHASLRKEAFLTKLI